MTEVSQVPSSLADLATTLPQIIMGGCGVKTTHLFGIRISEFHGHPKFQGPSSFSSSSSTSIIIISGIVEAKSLVSALFHGGFREALPNRPSAALAMLPLTGQPC